jgi:hypothetical protein
MFFIRLLAEGGPNTELAWILLIVFGFLFLMVVVGWVTSQRKRG